MELVDVLIHKKDDRVRKEFKKWAILTSLKAIRFDSVGCKPDDDANKQIVTERDK